MARRLLRSVGASGRALDSRIELVALWHRQTCVEASGVVRSLAVRVRESVVKAKRRLKSTKHHYYSSTDAAANATTSAIASTI